MTVPDARAVVGRYFTVMTKGHEYERRVHSVENRAQPNRLTEFNWSAASQVHADWRNVSPADRTSVLDRDLSALAAIPEDVDVLDTARYDEHFAELLDWLIGHRGIKVANATKLLYQKRPRLIPVMDEVARCVLGVAWTRGNRECALDGLAAVRLAATHARNRDVVEDVFAWIASGASPAGNLPVSRLRVIDILAWSVGKAAGAGGR